MNALSELASEAKFRERKRGYDYEDVDNYVKAVSRAAARAREQISELERRVAEVESRPADSDGGEEIREALLRTLVLAQRTADAAVSEARSEAESITDSAKERAAKTVSEAETAANERLRSAEERAAAMLAESEENSQLIIDEAKRTAAAELATERESAQRELSDLEASRRELEAVVAEIQGRLDDKRDTLRSLAVSFQSFVEKFEPIADVEDSTDEEVPDEPDPEPRLVLEALDANRTHDPDQIDSQVSDDDGADGEAGAAGEGSQDPAEDPAAGVSEPPLGDDHGGADPQTGIDASDVPEVPVVSWDDEIEHSPAARADAADAGTDEPEVSPWEPSVAGNGSTNRESDGTGREAAVASAGPATMPLDVESPELFDMDDEDDEEFIEQLRQMVSSDEPVPDRDSAMAAFFDRPGR